MVEWANALQISMIGGAFVFAYIASTIQLSDRFDNGLRVIFTLFAMLMVLASTGMNFSIMESQDPTLLNATNTGKALTGVFQGQLYIIAMVFLLLLIFSFVAIVLTIKKKKLEKQVGKSD